MLERYQSGDIITFQYCPVSGNKLPSPVNVRVLKVQIAYNQDESDFRPLKMKVLETKESLDDRDEKDDTESSDCSKSREFINYVPKFKGSKRKCLMCFDIGEE